MLGKQPSGVLHRFEVTFRHTPSSIDDVPFKLTLEIGNEYIRFADVHAFFG